MPFYLRYELPQTEKTEKITLKSYMISHYVTLGETLESVAKIYQADTSEFMRAKSLTK